MRQIVLFVLLAVSCVAAAQTGEKIGYYYKGQKIYFNLNLQHVTIQLADGENSRARQTSMAATWKTQGAMVKSTGPEGRLTINYSTPVTKEVIKNLQQQNFIKYVHPCFISTSGKTISYGEDVIVKLKPGTGAEILNKVLQQNNCSIKKKYAFAENIYVLKAGAANNYDPISVANRLFETGFFEYAEPDLSSFDVTAAADPNDPLYNLQWSHKNTGAIMQFSGTSGVDMSVQAAWTTSTGTGIKVAVIDKGVDITHPDLAANMLQGFDCISGTSNPGDGKPLADSNAHGTACAGIIAAIANNGIGVAGVAPNAKIIPINVAYSDGTFTTISDIAAGFDYAWQNGADIISNSWGGIAQNSMLDDAITRAITQGRGGKGCIVFFPSGNGNDVVQYPADLPSVISVGGVNMCGQLKSYTSCDGETGWGANYGIGLDVVAPCVKIATVDNSGTGGYNTLAGTDGDYYSTFGGTSAATPNAAAVAALVLAVNNNLTMLQLRNLLEGNCVKLAGYTYSTDVSMPNGTWNDETGYGMVNAFNAVQAALGTLPVTWISFTATAVNNQVQLVWKVGEDQNTSSYVIERSADGSLFTSLAVQNATTATTAEKQYKLTDPLPLQGINYYRIKQYDKNGRYGYSKIVQVRINAIKQVVIRPNPATDVVTVQNRQTITRLQCYNTSGQLLVDVNPAATQYNIAVAGWAKGMYVVKLTTAGQTVLANFVKQ